MVLGLVLLVICTSGVLLLYAPEITRVTHASAYGGSGGEVTTSLAGARAAVAAHSPDLDPASIWLTSDGLYTAMNYDTGDRVTVDGSTGEVIGAYNEKQGPLAGTMRFLVNLHECFLNCEDYPGYQAWLAKEVPGTGWLGFDGEKVTWSAVVLGVSGLLLLFLSLSGLWLWWPGLKRWANGVRVRWRRGRYARDYDLHQVAGMVAIPLLLLWAVTGMGFEFGFVEKAWYQAVPGEASPEVSFTSKEAKGPDLDLVAAQAAAVAAIATLAPRATIAGVDLPAADDPTAAYNFWFSNGNDPYAHGLYPGNLGVNVDRRDASRTAITYGPPDQSTAQLLWGDYSYTVHAGLAVNPWWRTIWAVLGLVPLLLAFTGLSTWLFKRGVRKRRRQAMAKTLPPPPAQPAPAAARAP